MSRLRLLALVLFCFPLLAGCQGELGHNVAEGAEAVPVDIQLSETDWPGWRGPSSDGIAPKSARPPARLDETELAWKAAIPGRGHSSPTIVGQRVVLTTADEQAQTQSVICLARKDGTLLWQTELFEDSFGHTNKKGSQASASVASDGHRFFICFFAHGSVWTTALDLAGKKLWEKEISRFTSHQGFGASPTIYGNNVIVAADNKGSGKGCLVALERSTGKVVWSQDRPVKPNYTSPIILKVSGRDQLLLAGCDQLAAYDPATGRQLWVADATTTECVGTAVVAEGLVFASGGYPKHETAAVRADGSGEVVWRNSVRVYVPSLLAFDKHIYTVTDDGVAYCWDAASGTERWKGRLGGGFTASPILAAGTIYFANENGEVILVEASAEKLVKTGSFQVGDEIMATPAFSGKQVFIRSTTHSDKRQEYVYCFGSN